MMKTLPIFQLARAEREQSKINLFSDIFISQYTPSTV